jgi:formylglycine-generating enzyme required for sulfatase activity
MTCNGEEYDCDSGRAGDQDCLFSTGSTTFPSCRTSWAAAGNVYDMSGNAREWTSTAVGSSIYEVRGGSYASIEAGRACDFDFTVSAASSAAGNTGFRCCYYGP